MTTSSPLDYCIKLILFTTHQTNLVGQPRFAICPWMLAATYYTIHYSLRQKPFIIFTKVLLETFHHMMLTFSLPSGNHRSIVQLYGIINSAYAPCPNWDANPSKTKLKIHFWHINKLRAFSVELPRSDPQIPSKTCFPWEVELMCLWMSEADTTWHKI